MRATGFQRFGLLFSFTVLFHPTELTAQGGFDWQPEVLEPVHLQRCVSIAAVGDVMLGSWVVELLEKHGPTYPFEPTRAYLESADVAIANLEAPFALSGEPFPKKFNFKVPPVYAAGLKTAGFDVLNLANNHILDFGEAALLSTMRTLDTLGLRYCGAGPNLAAAHRPTVVAVRGVRIAFFGYSMTFPTEFYAKEDSAGTAYPEPERMAATLRAWEDSVDYTVVSFHWGAEKRTTPKDYQIHFAHLAIDNGADLVLGHHPHVLQGFELYKNRLIAYSLGNFAFGSYSRYAVDSIILKVYLNEDGLVLARALPINVDNRVVEFRPEVAGPQRGARIVENLRALSAPLNAGAPLLRNSQLVFGDWHRFFEDWLLGVTVNAYWRVFLDLEALPHLPEIVQAPQGPSSGAAR